MLDILITHSSTYLYPGIYYAHICNRLLLNKNVERRYQVDSVEKNLVICGQMKNYMIN